MITVDKNIDNGNPFGWGRTSLDYADISENQIAPDELTILHYGAAAELRKK